MRGMELGRKGTERAHARRFLMAQQGMSGAGAGKFQVDIAPVLIQKARSCMQVLWSWSCSGCGFR